MSTRERLKDEYFFVAADYYVTGRFAFWAKLSGISGNLLHHSIEMFLKGHLLLTIAPEELRRKFGHNLPRLWDQLKTGIGDATLSRFDRTIDDVQRFEAIRYPEDVVSKGAQFHFQVRRRDLDRSEAETSVPGRLPTYRLALEEVDDLVSILFKVCSRNPEVFLRGKLPNVDRLKYLTESNPMWASQ